MKLALFHRLKCGLFFGCFVSLVMSFSVYAEQPRVFSIRLKQAPLVPTLQQLALAQNVNLIIDDELQGTLSLNWITWTWISSFDLLPKSSSWICGKKTAFII